MNLVSNSGFENQWSNWSLNNASQIAIKTETQSGKTNHYAELTGTPGAEVSVSQMIPVSGTQGDTYTFGGWINKYDATSPKDYDIKVQLYNGQTPVGEEAVVLLRPGNNSWIYMMSTVTADAAYTGLKITLCYHYGLNEVLFDDIQVYRGDVSTEYDYDENGNLSGITETPDSTDSDANDEDEETAQTTGAQSSSAAFEPLTFDSYNRIVTTTDKSGIENHLEYDEYSNPLVQYVTNGRVKIEERSEYSADGNIKTAEWNELGEKTTYSVDENFNTTNSVTDSAGNTKNMFYDSRHRLIRTETPVTDLTEGTKLTETYTYDSEDRLRSVNGYGINYDTFGRMSAVTLGSVNLLSYQYDTFANGGRLKQATYGNGQQLTYTYDAKGRLKSVGNGTNEIIHYVYGADGKLVMTQYTDQNNRERSCYIKYTTDSDGNDTVTTYDNNGVSTEQTYTSQYNKFTETVNGKTYTTNYTYTENGLLSGVSWKGVNGVSQHQIYYDDLGRVTSKGFYLTKNGAVTGILNSSYVYTDRAEYKTSNRVLAINHQANDYQRLIPYEYTANGMIKKAGDVTYVYDEAGQLTRVNDPQNGTTVYVYNQKGNIAAVQSYDYTVGELGTCKNTVSYTYGNSNWSDQLTSYNGQAITYDGAGNPTYYKSAQLSWKNGRYLSSYAADGYSVEYAYNAQGLRTYKKYEYQQDSGETHTTPFTYTYDANGRLTGQWYYDVPYFYFYYDKAGNPIALEYGGTVYYYVKNLQGDIIALLDRWGNCVVEYTYDAWGKVLSVTGSMAESLGNDNPLRYRGYYYDRETGLYYLQSRYYDPETGRFISADGVNMLLTGEQAYTYCGNNPITRSYPTGKTPTLVTTPYIEDPYLVNTTGWTDTVLRMGLSTDQLTYEQLVYAYHMNTNDDYNAALSDMYLKATEQIVWSEVVDYHAVVGKGSMQLSDRAFYAQTINNYYNNVIEWYYIPIEDCVYRQGFFTSWRYGIRSANNNSCGIISIYNAMTLLGRKVFLPDLFFLAEIHLLGGSWGTNTDKAIDYFSKKYGFKYKKTTQYRKLNKWSKAKDTILVLSYWNSPEKNTGSHAICAYIDVNQTINIYNYKDEIEETYVLNQWADEIMEEQFKYVLRIYE